jgi:DNA-binding PadR family transcriptional regulator
MALNQIELLTLVAMLRLGPDAYGVTLHEETERLAGRGVSMAGVYSALDRLERQGLARSWLSEPRAEQGGRARRHYELTAAGRARVRDERDRAMRMWRGLAPALQGRKR